MKKATTEAAARKTLKMTGANLRFAAWLSASQGCKCKNSNFA